MAFRLYNTPFKCDINKEFLHTNVISLAIRSPGKIGQKPYIGPSSGDKLLLQWGHLGGTDMATGVCGDCGQEKELGTRTVCEACRKRSQRAKKESQENLEDLLFKAEEHYGIRVDRDNLLAWRSVSSHPKGGYFVTPHEDKKYGLCLNPDCKMERVNARA